MFRVRLFIQHFIGQSDETGGGFREPGAIGVLRQGDQAIRKDKRADGNRKGWSKSQHGFVLR